MVKSVLWHKRIRESNCKKKVRVVCEVCDKVEYKLPWEAKIYKRCSRACYYKHREGHETSKETKDKISKANSVSRPERCGKNHPNYKPKIKCICSYCGKVVKLHPYRIDKSRRYYCNRKCHDSHQVGELAPGWKGGISREPYPFEFNDSLKNSIKERDDYQCQACGASKDIVIHHVNYIKKDCEPFNLITLCRSCHSKTGVNRKYWFAEFMGLQAFNLIGVIYG